MFIFNPSHELALAANTVQYTPPRMVQQMEDDLQAFPSLFADCNDEGVSVWGWNKSIKAALLRRGIEESLMPTDAAIDEIRHLASREYAVTYRNLLQSEFPCKEFVDNEMCIVTTNGSSDGCNISSGGTFITKTLWSSSGRGIRIVRDGRLPRPPYLLDRYYNKKIDFAMEFCVTPDKVEYLGLSVFEASADGKYEFNYVLSQSSLLDLILAKGIPPSIIEHLSHSHLSLLSRQLIGRYSGIVGIDMMVVEGGKIHPCVELNFRMNMGVVAMRLFERYGCTHTLSIGNPHGFQAVLNKDRFYIQFSGN